MKPAAAKALYYSFCSQLSLIDGLLRSGALTGEHAQAALCDILGAAEKCRDFRPEKWDPLINKARRLHDEFCGGGL